MLPVKDIYPALVETLKHHNRALLQAPPGAGKSTWLPLQLIRDGHFQHIVMLEPRRLAARNIANYLARCQNEKLGQSIGLRIRQEKYLSKNTRLEIVTDAMLTRMLQNDPELSGIDCIIFDEFHERSVAADTGLALSLETQATLRDDLTILLMSATLDAEKIAAKFQCPVITSQGRSFPVDEVYQPLRDEQRWLDAIPPLIQKAIQEQPGSCLVFLPGQREIRQVAQRLSHLGDDIHVCPLYGEQTKAVQQAAIAPAPAGERKIVLATNVAETSLTIEGIRLVVDSGKKRAAMFNLNTGVTELKTVNISMASATQRAGRAGRIEPGVVYRLGSKESFSRRPAHDIPDILSSDISPLLLEAKQWGTPLNELELLDTPTAAQQQQANELLTMLEAVDPQNKITPLGQRLLQLGTNIRWGHMLIKAQALESRLPGIESLSLHLLALWDSGIGREPELSVALQSQINAPQPAFTRQLQFWRQRTGHNPASTMTLSHLPLLVALAYPDRIAKRRGEGYLLANGAGVDGRHDYWVHDEFIAIADLGGQNGNTIFSATAVDIHQLQEHLPHLFQTKSVCEFDESSGRFIYEERRLLNALVVHSKPIDTPIDPAVRTAAWIDLIKAKGFTLFHCVTSNLAEKEHNPFIQLLTRMTLAHRHFPEEFPSIDEPHLLATSDVWLSPFLGDVKNLEQLKRVDLLEPLKSCLDWNQQAALDALLPKRITVPSGSSIAISYPLNGPAKLSVRMQEVYGLSSTPTLCRGKITLLMDLLSPAHRSLQLTEDLEGFWQGSYQAIKKEMKGRYPKHFWPDNPEQAKATRKTKAKM